MIKEEFKIKYQLEISKKNENNDFISLILNITLIWMF